MVLGALVTVAMLIVAMWAVMHAQQLVTYWGAGQRRIGAWAIYSAALGAAGAAHIVMFSLVIENLYDRDLLSDMFKLVAGLLSSIALVGAIALALAAR
jgi:hypothetical protein